MKNVLSKNLTLVILLLLISVVVALNLPDDSEKDESTAMCASTKVSAISFAPVTISSDDSEKIMMRISPSLHRAIKG